MKMILPTRKLSHDRDLLVRVLRCAGDGSGLSAAEWSVVIAQARACRLLARLAVHLEPVAQELPDNVRDILQRALAQAEHEARTVRWEVERLDALFHALAVPCILLKGTAYALAGLQAARGRVFNDIDILVPKERIAEVEEVLHAHDWQSVEMLPHQEHYFRKWLHEVPAMSHAQRGTRLDLHHNILPAIDRLQPNPELFFTAARALPGYRSIWVMAPTDMVMHAAVHLFRRGEYRNALRDLVDMKTLIIEFSARNPQFWSELTQRVESVKLGVPLFLALRAIRRYLGLDIPTASTESVIDRWQPHWPPLPYLDSLVHAGVRPPRLGALSRDRDIAHYLLERYPLSLWGKTIRPKLERTWFKLTQGTTTGDDD